ncbi:YtxH domain-containing protein [Kineococcus indalonis]|uniref:YtxH domain-containing protein n=1 Tax=Kineococcus indalonis TaxID=2696566 RepID=UPI001412A5EF|nr:YtxH domain-containing protein [Kineococcus indalonis]NAZ86695.1 YtxH domain-containing protein [Kineococcus indalonis]
MKGKVLFLVAGAAGYVLGARAGRERYEQISSVASRAWGNPKVQQKVGDLEGRAADVAKQAGSAAQEKVSAAAGSVAGSVRSKVGGGSADGEGGGGGGGMVYDPASASGVASVDEPLGEQHHTRMPND